MWATAHGTLDWNGAIVTDLGNQGKGRPSSRLAAWTPRSAIRHRVALVPLSRQAIKERSVPRRDGRIGILYRQPASRVSIGQIEAIAQGDGKLCCLFQRIQSCDACERRACALHIHRGLRMSSLTAARHSRIRPLLLQLDSTLTAPMTVLVVKSKIHVDVFTVCII